MPLSIAPGTKLGQYEVQDFIGQGAMGLVYRAYHVQLERTGAVKILQGIAPDPASTARFRHEAQAIAQMRHPNILNVYDFGEHDGMPYMIVEYVPGGSLGDKLGQGPLDPGAALRYLRGVAAGLDYAHGLGIVHRDVKPANILLEKDDTPVLADFGLVKLMQGTSLRSMTGVTTGTPAYMAPEQVTGNDVGPAADRYSLATIAYEMLTGVIPFDGEGLIEVLYAQVHRDSPLPSSRNTSLGPEVDAVIMRGLAKDPAARWETCAAFVDALAAALAVKRVAPTTAAAMVMVPAVPATVALATPALPATQTPAANGNGRHPSMTVAVAFPQPAQTVAVAYPTPTQAVAKRKPRKGLFALVAGVILLVLLFVGVAGYLAAQGKTTLSLSAYTVTPGDTIFATASHVPANQVGEIQLLSTVRIFPYRSDANGNVTANITVPRNIEMGLHTVKICWASQCHASVSLHVVDAVAAVNPSPGATPSTTPDASPSPTAPTGTNPTPGGGTPPPGQTPAPRASPAPTSAPVPTPTPPPPPPPTPRPSPIPSPIPSPTPTPAASITLVSISATGNTTMVFHNFYGGTATVSVCQGGTCHAGGTVTVAPGSSSTVTFKTPAGILPTAILIGPAYVTAGSLTSGSVSVGV